MSASAPVETTEQRLDRLWKTRRAEFYLWNSKNCRCPKDRGATFAETHACELANFPVWAATLPADA